jgi:hypothetical protein
MHRLELTPDQHAELVHLRDRAPQPYLRERAAGLLQIAAGRSAHAVAQRGLLRRRQAPTVLAWLHRYQAAGVAGLAIRPGRGRKPAFSPSLPERGAGDGRPAAPAAA